MKLHKSISEAHPVPVPVQMVLAQIIRDKGVTNSYQIYVLGWLTDYFKSNPNGGVDLSAPMTAGGTATSTEAVNTLKSLSGEDQVSLATYLLNRIIEQENGVQQPSAEAIDWMKFVLRKQD